jgi:diguanylate cyclase (GGDEF)-like protein/PAS domain S-box-containing protein
MPLANDNPQIQQLSEALRDAQRRLQDVVSASGAGLGTFEFVLRKDGGLEFVGSTPAGDRLLGFEGQPPYGKRLQDLFPDLAGTDLPAALAGVARHGGVLERNLAPKGSLPSVRAYMFFAFQTAPDRMAIKVADTTQGFIAESEKRRSESLFEAAFNESPEAIALSRLRDGLIIDVNQEWLRLHGYTRAEVLGRTVVELGIWPDRKTRDAVVAPLVAQGRMRDQEAKVTIRGGHQRLVRLCGSVIDVAGEPHILLYIRDITDERLADEAMHASELALMQANDKLNEQVGLHEITESLANVGYWIASPDGTQIHWSGGLRRLAGMTQGPIVSSPDSRSRIHIDDLADFALARQRMDGSELEYRWWHADGTIRWLRSRMRRQLKSDGSMIDFGVVQDITAEREVTLALRERLAFIQKMTSRVPGMVFQFTVRPDGTSYLPFVSESVREIFGITPEDARESTAQIFSAIHPDDVEAMVASIQQSVRDIRPWSHEFRVRYPDGSERWYWGNAVPEREAEGGIVAYGSLTDINERKHAQAALTLTRVGVERTSDAMLWITPEGRIVDVNAATCRSLGYSREELMQMSIPDLNPSYNPQSWVGHFAELRDNGSLTFETEHRTRDGRFFPVEVVANYVKFGDLELNCAFVRDISQRKRSEAEIQRLAYFDGLTGLPNRILLLDRLAKTLTLSRRRLSHGALLFIDLDNFKDLNDSSGHDVGDKLLQQVGQRLTTCVREGDTVARLGGDEFVVMLEDLSEEAGAAAAQTEAVAVKILAALNRVYDLEGKQHYSSPSIGVTMFHDSLQSVDELLKRADLAMYEAKAAGRNTMRFFDPEMQTVVANRTALESDLRQGLQRDELVLHYQPVVDVAGKILGVEALVRWQHPQRGLMVPGDFIPMAEQTGLIQPLGHWVLQAACQQLALWSIRPATAGLTLAVNVSARQFRHPEFVSQVIALLKDTGANPFRLKLELTESLLLHDVEDAIRKMDELRAMGFSFSLDDFGTGYSSLSYLKRLPLEQIKIDQSFVRDVMTDPNDAAIVQTILALGQSLGFTVVAEGVETREQRDFLLQHGCQVFQGYLFGRPSPVQDLF